MFGFNGKTHSYTTNPGQGHFQITNEWNWLILIINQMPIPLPLNIILLCQLSSIQRMISMFRNGQFTSPAWCKMRSIWSKTQVEINQTPVLYYIYIYIYILIPTFVNVHCYWLPPCICDRIQIISIMFRCIFAAYIAQITSKILPFDSCSEAYIQLFIFQDKQ